MTPDRFSQLLALLRRLRDAKIHFSIEQTRDDALAVLVAVPGERWEIEFLEDGGIKVERFRSDGVMSSEASLDELFAKFSD